MRRKINPFYDSISLFKLYFFFRKNKFDIVHTHSTQAGIYGRIAAWLAGVPIIIHTIHGSPFSETRNFLINHSTLILEKFCAKISTKIISNADILTQEYTVRGIGTKKKYITIYSGIDLKKFENPIPIQKIRNASNFNIALISRVTEGKGHIEAYQAMKLLDNEGIHLFIVGDGDMYEEYKKLYKNKNITYLGYRNDIANIIASCDLIILPSYREGTPRSITEAMASGKPVIATNIAGIPEQIIDGKNGILIPIKNSKILVEKIILLKNNPDLCAKLGAEGKKMSVKFSLENMQVNIEKLYFEIYTKLFKINNN
jgi:glycosyltransferase involved in cell wall biosynthesis